MGNLLKTLKEHAALDAEEQADLISMEGAQVFCAEPEPFFLGQEIWWKPYTTVPEVGPGKILFLKIDYKLLHQETRHQRPQIERDFPRCSYGQVVSRVLVEFKGRERSVVPSTITRRRTHSPDHLSETSGSTDIFVSCECDIPMVGSNFAIRRCSCGEKFELCICYKCGAITRIPAPNDEPCY